MTMTNTATATAATTSIATGAAAADGAPIVGGSMLHANRIIVDVAADNAMATRLLHPRNEVLSALRVAIDKGGEIRDRRIRYQDDLDEARAAKLKWSAAVNDLLSALFDNSSVADYCNDWVGKIFPEYADIGNFVEQFYEEMEYRLAKLRKVLERVEQVPDAAPPPPAPAAEVAPLPEVTAPAPVAPQYPTPAPPAAAPAPVARVAPAAPAPAQPRRAAPPAKPIVTHAAEPVAVPTVLLLGAPTTDPALAEAVELLKGLSVTARAAQDPLAAGPSDAAVFVLSGAPADPAGSRAALFQLGCAVGRLGANRVCVLLAPGAAPLAEAGVPHITLDSGGGWHLQLLRHLKQAGIHVDLNRLC